jgi:hypothetical protein
VRRNMMETTLMILQVSLLEKDLLFIAR